MHGSRLKLKSESTPVYTVGFAIYSPESLPLIIRPLAKVACRSGFQPDTPVKDEVWRVINLPYKYLCKRSITRKPEKPSVEVKPSVFTLVPAQITGLKGEKEGDLEIQLFNLILGLDKKRQNAKGKPLRAVSPNWFITGSSSSPGGTGGPGSRPDAYDGSPETHEHEFDLQYLPPAIRDQVQTGKKGTGIDVA